MSPNHEVSPELQTLIDRLLDDMITEDEAQRLETALRGDPAAQAYFRRYCQLHINLDTATRVERVVEAFKARPLRPAPLPEATPIAPLSLQWLWTRLASGGRGLVRSPRVSLALAVVLAALIGAGIYFRGWASARPDHTDLAANHTATAPSADELDVIRIRLNTEEIRSVELGSKGKVLVEGPADLELIGTSYGRLHRGRVRINKSDGKGFVLETPRGVVTDLSTEFGVGVAGDEATDVIVFDGAVELAAAGGNPSPIRLVRGEGVMVGKAGELDRVMSIVTDAEGLFRRGGDLGEGPVPLITDVRDNIRASETRQFYEIVAGGLCEDALCYVDRPEHDWNGVNERGMPAYLLGADYVKTFSSDKIRSNLKISVTLSRPAKLYVFMDERISPPQWLRADFKPTGDDLGRDNGKTDASPGMKDYVREFGAGNSIDYRHAIWVRTVNKPGIVELGPNLGANDGTAMYGIAAVAIEPDTSTPPVPTEVRPIDWSHFTGLTGVQPDDEFGRQLTAIVQRQSAYLYGLIPSKYPIETFSQFNDVPGYYVRTAGIGNSLRSLAHFAWGNAVMLRTGVFEAAQANVSTEEALRRTELAIRGVAMTHAANLAVNRSRRWGQGVRNRSWQAAYWASRAAQAAWMLWDQLSPETRQAVAMMLKYEADAFIQYPVPYWRNKAGTPLSPGDTKAEENAWNSRILVIAQAMMPNDPNVAQWRCKASELMISAYSRPSDIENPTVVDGKPVRDWLNGYNTFDDGVLVNHRIVHPDYVSVHTLTYDTLVDATLAGQYIPASAFFNAQITWDAMTRLQFKAGTNPYGDREAKPICPPGGTVFHKRADGTLDPVLYFPNGNDWSYNPAVDNNYILFLVYGHVQGLDRGQDVSALEWAAVQLEALKTLQNRRDHHGNLYQTGDWNGDLTTVEVDAYRELAESWLVHWLHQHDMISPSGDWGPIHGQPERATQARPQASARATPPRLP